MTLRKRNDCLSFKKNFCGKEYTMYTEILSVDVTFSMEIRCEKYYWRKNSYVHVTTFGQLRPVSQKITKSHLYIL